jgi:hypothetical protein
MSIIKLNLNVDEVDTVLSALGEQPYIKVSGVITKIRDQAVPQWKAIQEAQETLTLTNEDNPS